MCTFCSDLPSHSRTSGSAKKRNITIFLSPNDPDNPKEAYRFRLLWFKKPEENNRDFPFIERQVHTHWGKTESGKAYVDDTVVCPYTKFVDIDGDDCPICKQANALAPWAPQNRGNKIAMKKFNQLKRTYQAIIPVFVVNDPKKPENNGKLMCFILNNNDEYKQLIKTINEEKAKIRAGGNKYDCFNGKQGVDLFIRMEKVPELRNAGKPNEYTAEVRKITTMGFGKNVYDIDAINKEAIDDFEFDQQYFVTNTIQELKAFYNKYYALGGANVPDEDIAGLVNTAKPKEQKTIVENKEISNNSDSVPESDMDSMVDDMPFDEPSKSNETSKTDTPPSDEPGSDTDVDSLIDELEMP